MIPNNNTMLKVVSILFIVFSSIVFLLVLMPLLITGGALGSVLIGFGAGGLGILLIGALLLSCAGTVVEFIAGILGVRKMYSPKSCLTLGIIIIALIVVSTILQIATSGTTNWISTLIGLVLPILYIVASQKQPTPPQA